MNRPRTHATGMVAVCLVLALSGIGATQAPESVPSSLCIPLLMDCSSPTTSTSPSPTPTPAPTAGVPGLLPGTGSTPVTGSAPDTATSSAPAVSDASAPTFTLPAAQLGGSSISFSGLRSVTAVTVPLADGTRTPALKLVADDIVIDGFMLDVRKATGPSLVSTATRMELRGNVQVYVDSVTASLQDGTALTLGAATPPPGGELPSTLLRVNLGLVGVTADSIAFESSHQSLK